MPFLQVMANRASECFSLDNLSNLNPGLAQGASLEQVSVSLNIARTQAEQDVLTSLPATIKQALVSVIDCALNPPGGGGPLQITFSWSPAYDYAIKVWEAHGVPGSAAAITVHLEGPYPDPGAQGS